MSNLTFSEAARLFEQWGFHLEPGPRQGEITLILETPESCTYAVYPTALLPEMASIALEVRWRNGSVVQQTPHPLSLPCC
ncbi:MAG: hypothetical protein JXB35_06395 [Anaerolineae bacterium]|nr:hypothetical protein [Anaerolineae bacterium]